MGAAVGIGGGSVVAVGSGVEVGTGLGVDVCKGVGEAGTWMEMTAPDLTGEDANVCAGNVGEGSGVGDGTMSTTAPWQEAISIASMNTNSRTRDFRPLGCVTNNTIRSAP